ncbi:TonB-dependent receptor domain-containing protein [Mucilaginibacter sp. Mucisp86]|uniref:TonB-dependent receptor domain-containing protein n=1 Tax=Mucilaginibacter sp. Mucisp86 TaxID=3243060 RepID=UPI0039B489D8
MRFLLYLCILPLILLHFNTFGQAAFSGQVITSSCESVELATVRILNSSKKVIQAGVTEKNGTFRIVASIQEARFLCASYLNDKSDTIGIGKADSSYTLIIAQNKTTLSEVKVSSTAQTLTRQSDRFIFTPDRLVTKGAAAIDILKITPLIQFDDKSELFSIINKQGTTIYINNKKSTMPKDMILSILRSTSADNIKNIEIITNPGSEYRAAITGGIININLKRAANDGWQGNFSFSDEQGAFNTGIFNGTLNYHKHKVGVRVSPFINDSYNYNTSQNTISNTDVPAQVNNMTYHRRYLVLGGGIGVDYDIDQRNILSFNGFASSVNGNSRRRNMTAYYSQTLSSPDSAYHTLTSGKDNYLYNFGNVYFQHQFDSVGKQRLTINVDYNQYHQTDNDLVAFDKVQPAVGSGSTLYKNILPQRFFNISEEADYTNALSKSSSITAGVQVSNTTMNNDLLYQTYDSRTQSYIINRTISNNYKYEENYSAVFVSLNKTISKKLQGSIGLRGENIYYSSRNKSTSESADSSYFNLFPNLSLQYALNDNENVSMSFAKKIKRPALDLLFPGRTYYTPTLYSENNPFLRPVNLYSVDFMYTLKNRYFVSSGYGLSKNQYARFVIPVSDTTGAPLKRTYLNYGNYWNAYLSFYTAQSFFNGFWNLNLSAVLNYDHYSLNEGSTVISSEKEVENWNYTISSNNTLFLSKKRQLFGFVTLQYVSPTNNISVKTESSLFLTQLGIRKNFNAISLSLFVSDPFNTNGRTTSLAHPNRAYAFNELRQNNYTRSASISLRYTFGNNKLKSVKNKNSANEDIKRRL